MKKLINKSALFAALLALVSCSEENVIDENQDRNNTFSTSRTSLANEENVVNFLYKGREYNSSFSIVNDSLIEYDNPEVQKLEESFDLKPNLVTFIYPNGKIEYFDSYEEYQSSMEQIKRSINTFCNELGNNVNSREELPGLPNPDDMYNHDAELKLFDDDWFSDTEGKIYVEKGQTQVGVTHLKKHFSPNMNDKTTSYQAFSMVGDFLFELFEDDNYKSHCMAFVVKHGIRTHFTNEEFSINYADPLNDTPVLPDERVNWGCTVDENLKDNHVVGTHNSSWNDRITSVRITKQ